MVCIYYNIGLLGAYITRNAPLRGASLADFPCMKNAYLITQQDYILEYGSMLELPFEKYPSAHRIDVAGGALFPSWCDSHTHLVFAGSREHEFVDKIKGLSYAEIAAKGVEYLIQQLNCSKPMNKSCMSWRRSGSAN